MKRRTALGESARYLAMGAGTLLLISLFLKWGFEFEESEGTRNAFDVFVRIQVLILAIAILIVAAAVVDLFVRWDGLLPLAGIFGALVCGFLFFAMLESKFKEEPVGWWVALLAGAGAAVAGYLAVLELVHAPKQTASAGGTAGPPVAPPTGLLQAGWYPDPWGTAPTRYWSGEAWTGQTK